MASDGGDAGVASGCEESRCAIVSMVLQIEKPTLSEKMVDYLKSVEGCGALCAFVALDGATVALPAYGERAPAGDGGDGAAPHVALKRSYRAARLLAGDDDGGDGLLPHLGPRAALVTRRLLAVFTDDARGCARHAVRAAARKKGQPCFPST